MDSDYIDKATTIADVRLALRDALTPKYGAGEAAAMARLILTTLKGWDLPRLLANEGREAGEYIKGRSKEILNALMRDVPIQYALGEAHFYGLTLKVGTGVLIPRPETEELVDLIVKENPGDDLNVLDLCTGSGAIALALSRNLPFSKVMAVDVAPQAVETARENASRLKARIEIIRADVFTFDSTAPEVRALAGKFDIIVANPPYVDESEKASMEPNVLEYEPSIALFVPDGDPLRFYRRIAEIGRGLLRPGGRLYFEINPRHAGELRRLLESQGYEGVEIVRDAHGRDRFAKAVLTR